MKTTLVCLFLSTLAYSTASAETLSSTLDEDVRETSHSVEITFDPGIVTYVVRRSFSNAGERPDEANLWIDVPQLAAATGLRIRVGERWYDGELMEAEKAAELYRELTGLGPHTMRDPALLAWLGETQLRLTVFPVPVGGVATVEYTLTAPSDYENGEYSCTYPRWSGDPALATPVLSVTNYDAPLTVNRRFVPPDQPVVLDRSPPAEECEVTETESCDGIAVIAMRDDFSKIRGRVGRVRAGDFRFSRLDLDMPAQLSKVPKDAKVVFVVDGSLSMSEDRRAAQWRAIGGFLQHVPDATFDIVIYDRSAKRVAGKLVPATDFERIFRESQAAGLLDGQNGSNLDLGLGVARKLLRGASSPTFVIAFTDDVFRPSMDVQKLEQGNQRDDDVTHMVVLNHASNEMDRRDDDHRLSSVANRDGGILLFGGGLSGATDDDVRAMMMGLVRPVRVDFGQITGLDDGPVEYYEGTSVRETFDYDVGTVKLTGMLWTKPVDRRFIRTRVFDRATAGWVFSDGQHHSLDEDAMMQLAIFARAVSPVTSYLAIEPGVRPSEFGIDRMGAGGLGARGFGVGGGGVGYYRSISPPPLPMIAPLVDSQLDACMADHAGQIDLRVHTTYVEIVDVLEGNSTAANTCAAEVLWAARLPEKFARHASGVEVIKRIR